METKFIAFELKEYQTEAWARVLDFAFKKSNLVQFVVVNSRQVSSIIEKKSDVIDDFTSNYRWFNKQLGKSRFVQIELNNYLKKEIRDVECLEDWLFIYPEDPTFYLNVELIIWTISHSKTVFINEKYYKKGLIKEEECNSINEVMYDLSNI